MEWLYLAVGFTIIYSGEAFYKPFCQENMTVYVPTTLQEVKKYLCNKMVKGYCVDTLPATIFINKTFDFTGSEGYATEVGCFQSTNPDMCPDGQLRLEFGWNKCDESYMKTNITYSVAGRQGIDVGSNKIIIGQNGGGFRGKGLRLNKSYNVEIRCLRITDVNPQVVWAGDALNLINVDNVLIDGNYIKNIGRQMLVTHIGNNTGVTISNNIFDGHTPYSATCNGAHYWLWLFCGDGDMITLQNNIIYGTSGRGPHLLAAHNGKSFVHMIHNTFYDIKGMGLVDLGDMRSSMLVEGNMFVNVTEVVHNNKGNIYMPQNYDDKKACLVPLGRPCFANTVVNSEKAYLQNSLQVLSDFGEFKDQLTKPKQIGLCLRCNLMILPKNIRKLIRNLQQSIKRFLKTPYFEN